MSKVNLKRDQVLDVAATSGILRPRDLRSHGISPSYLSLLAKEGILRRTSRGIYVKNDHSVTEWHSLALACKTYPTGVVCLLSALSFHGIGTQSPSKIWLAVPYGSRVTQDSHPGMRVVAVRPHLLPIGVEVTSIEGVPVPITGIARTVVDCFKFRNKIGLDVALEALREVLAGNRCHRDELARIAVRNRMEDVMRPYLEALS